KSAGLVEGVVERETGVVHAAVPHAVRGAAPPPGTGAAGRGMVVGVPDPVDRVPDLDRLGHGRKHHEVTYWTNMDGKRGKYRPVSQAHHFGPIPPTAGRRGRGGPVNPTPPKR